MIDDYKLVQDAAVFFRANSEYMSASLFDRICERILGYNISNLTYTEIVRFCAAKIAELENEDLDQTLG